MTEAVSIQALIDDAFADQQQGRLDQAWRRFSLVLAIAPDNPGIVHMLGVVSVLRGAYDVAAPWLARAADLDPTIFDFHNNLGVARHRRADHPGAEIALRRALTLRPDSSDGWDNLVGVRYKRLDYEGAERARRVAERLDPSPPQPVASAVIAVLDEQSAHSPWNIRTLLDDLQDFPGEVICVFNDRSVGERLKDHPRIDKWSLNKFNVGVARGWNIGIAQAEGEVVFILNADLHIAAPTLMGMADWLHRLDDALLVGLDGEQFSTTDFVTKDRASADSVAEPIAVDRLAGYCFGFHADRFHDLGLSFDPRLSPFFFEESDIALKARAAGLKAYVVPATGYAHVYGISLNDRPLNYMGRTVRRSRSMITNWQLMRRKVNAGLLAKSGG